MATTAEIDAALTALRSARVVLANATETRARAVLARDTANEALTNATAAALAARSDVNAKKEAARLLLSEPEV
jgi:hypothetical protein